jgi:simple sugar transport system permease protein
MAQKSFSLAAGLNTLRRHKIGNIIIVFFTIQILAVIFALIFPEQFRYLDVKNIQVLFKDIPQVGVIALGVNILMIAGEFDLSVGATFTFTALCMAKIFNSGVNVWVAALIGLAIGGAIGWLNGFITVRSKVPSFIITLGSMMFWRGIILLLSQSVTERFAPGTVFEAIFTSSIGPIQVQFIWLVGLTVLTWFLLERHKIGNHFFAVGGNRTAAMALGINPNRVKIMAFVITGVLAAFSGILSTVRVASVSPIQGEGFELQAIAASVIGGTALMGGSGSMVGAFLGAALLSTIQDFLLLLRAPGAYLRLFVGVIVVFAAILNQLLKKD